MRSSFPQALTEFNCEASHAWHMNDTESEIKFDALVSTKTLYLQGNRLTQIPKFKKMRKLIYVNLGFNVITRIAPGDFAGATQLSILILSGNAIVSVAASAFRNLAALNMAQEKFFPQNALDASRYKNAIGLGACYGMAGCGGFCAQALWPCHGCAGEDRTGQHGCTCTL